MNRLQTTLDHLANSNRKALLSYVVAGDPDTATTVRLMHELVSSGTNIIELGVPFSDPSAEGPVIQLAHERALESKTGMRQVLAVVAEFRTKDALTPIVLMGYANPIEWMGYQEFCKAAVAAGVDGTLVVDIPPEEAGSLNAVLTEHGLYNVFLLAPTTSEERIKAICNYASGFLYYVSLKGVTGSAALDVDSVERKLNQIRAHTDLPLCVGFGIKDAESAAAVAAVADGVVVGSAFVSLVAKATDNDQRFEQVGALAKEIRSAIDQA